jgi:hypothetical protein
LEMLGKKVWTPPSGVGRVAPTEPRTHSFTLLSRSALAMTLTDESAIAAAAITGDNVRPIKGYSTPAAIGTPAALYTNAKARF